MRSATTRVLGAVAAATAGALLWGGCGPVRSGAPDRDALPGYCSSGSGGDAAFWDLIKSSCQHATDGDIQQGAALKATLQPLSVHEVAAFYRTFVRMNHALRTPGLDDVMAQVCAPGLGLGDDLSTDLRSWVIAHGQAAYEWVLTDPRHLTGFPDLPDGCGLGEPFGDVGYRVAKAKGADASSLPVLEDDSQNGSDTP